MTHTTFPGRIFGPDAASLTPGQPSLSQSDLDAHPFRHLVVETGTPDVVRCWMLNAGATFEAIPESIVAAEAIGLIRYGHAIMVIGRTEESTDAVVRGLMTALQTTGEVGTA